MFASLVPQWGSPIKVVGCFFKCWRVITWEVLCADHQTLQQKTFFWKAEEQRLNPDVAGRPGTQLLAPGHGGGGGEPGPPNRLSFSAWGRSLHVFHFKCKNVRRSFLQRSTQGLSFFCIGFLKSLARRKTLTIQ